MHVGKYSVSQLLALVGLRKCSKHRLYEPTILILDIYKKRNKSVPLYYTHKTTCSSLKLDIVQVRNCGEPD